MTDSSSTLAVAHDDDDVAPVYMSTTSNTYEETTIEDDTNVIPEEEGVHEIEKLKVTQHQKVKEDPVAPIVVTNTVEDYYASLGYEEAAPQL